MVTARLSYHSRAALLLEISADSQQDSIADWAPPKEPANCQVLASIGQMSMLTIQDWLWLDNAHSSSYSQRARQAPHSAQAYSAALLSPTDTSRPILLDNTHQQSIILLQHIITC